MALCPDVYPCRPQATSGRTSTCNIQSSRCTQIPSSFRFTPQLLVEIVHVNVRCIMGESCFSTLIQKAVWGHYGSTINVGTITDLRALSAEHNYFWLTLCGTWDEPILLGHYLLGTVIVGVYTNCCQVYYLYTNIFWGYICGSNYCQRPVCSQLF